MKFDNQYLIIDGKKIPVEFGVYDEKEAQRYEELIDAAFEHCSDIARFWAQIFADAITDSRDNEEDE